MKQRRGSWHVAVVAVTVVVSGCAGRTTPANEAELRFPYEPASYALIQDHRAVARAAAPVYVKVTVYAKSDRHAGPETGNEVRVVSGASGIIVDPAGHVVTAAHIARGTGFEAKVEMLDGRVFPAQIRHVEAAAELALLRIRKPGALTAAVPGAPPSQGQPVLAIGTPGNRAGAVSVGRVIRPRLRKRIQYGEFGFDDSIELAIHVEPGHSGGPVFDDQGLLLGMLVGFDLRRTVNGDYVHTGVAYAIPASTIDEFVRRWARDAGNN